MGPWRASALAPGGLLNLTMSLRLAVLVLLATNVHGGPVPPLSESIAANHGTPVDINTVNMVNTAAAVNALSAGINVLISWISFLIPPSNVKGRLAVLMTSFVVKMNIINNSITMAPTTEETVKVRCRQQFEKYNTL